MTAVATSSIVGDRAPDPRAIARVAVASLHAELVLVPKPGLVCPGDRGSHDDMDASTMMRSLFALRHGFIAMAERAADGASFDALQAIGIETEHAMLRATGGVNTHRGAIFTLGLLVASTAAALHAHGRPQTSESLSFASLSVATLRSTLRERWGRALRVRSVAETSHGLAMAARFDAGGARAEAAEGFPALFGVVLPALQAAQAAGLDARAARLHALMSSIAHVEDTNLLYRGGREGLLFAQAAARDFLATGGVMRADRDDALRAIGRDFVARRLSPGGSADLLAAAIFVDRVTGGA
jgi:triphosphoribosyl-dephospho-CoA synthase